MSASNRRDEMDPVVATLAEALADSEPMTTLFWGRAMGPLALQSCAMMEAELLVGDVTLGFSGTLNSSVAAEPDAGRRYDRIICRLPRSKAELQWRLQVAASRLAPQGTVWLVGHRQEGIKSASTSLQAAVGPVALLRNKRRVRVLAATRQTDGVETAPQEADFMASFEAGFAGHTLCLKTFPGTFAHGRVDEGTQRMLAVLDLLDAPQKVLDMGTGCGVLGLALATKFPDAEVDLLDVSVASQVSVTHGLHANGIEPNGRVRFHLASVTDAPKGRFDLIVTNPPFHEGRHQNRGLIHDFAEQAAIRLAAQGLFLVVANRTLGYRTDLEGFFKSVQVIKEDNLFRVWRCERPLHPR